MPHPTIRSEQLLATLFLVGVVIDAQVGTQLGTRLKAKQLHILLAVVALGVCGKIGLYLNLQSAELY